MTDFVAGRNPHNIKIIAVFVTAAAGLVFAGCGNKDAETPPAAPAANQTAPAGGGVKGGVPSDPAQELKQLQDEKKAGK